MRKPIAGFLFGETDFAAGRFADYNQGIP